MRILALLLTLALPVTGFAQTKTEYPALKQRLQRGNYAEARAGYEPLCKSEKPELAAFLGLAACERAEGHYDEALEVYDRGLKALPDNAELLAQRADLYFFLGKWDEAARDAESAITREDSCFLARWVRARLLRDKGDIAAADKEVRWFVKAYSDASQAGKDIVDVDRLLIVGQAGAENARWNNKPQQFNFILNEVIKDALKIDPDCWMAEDLAGRLLAEKHNRADAAEAYDNALKINPKAVEALIGKGLLALDELRSAEAGQLADQALKVNPRHPEALRLKADVRLAEGDAASAERLLLASKLVNRRDERTLARLALLHHLARKPEAYAAAVKEVESFCAKPGIFYAELAEVLTSRKQFTLAEACFQKAMELRPDLSSPRAGLGLLYLQLGDEEKARQQLEAAFKADPFHVRVSNALKVLKHLDGYAVITTKHFVIKYDPRTDKVQAAFAADYLEQLHAEFAKLYGYAPEHTLVEFIATREMFSGRVLALPGLPGAAQGASTGPLIAIPSSHGEKGSRLFNWGVVLRHELTHAFNLTQTDFRVPIWLTEGLAVRAERTRRFEASNALLRERLAAGTTFDLDSIGRAYHNFGNPPDVILAYYQGFLYVEHIIATYGKEAIAGLLEAYRLGLDTSDAIRRACGVEKSAFEKGYREYLRGTVKNIPRPQKAMSQAELEAAYQKDPDDVDISARLAGEYLRRGKSAEAKKLAESALAKEPGHPAASLVKARILQREKDAPGAVAVLEAAVQANPEDVRLLFALAELYIKVKDPENAAEAYEAIRKQGLADNEILHALEKLYTTGNKTEPLLDVLAELAARDPDAIDIRLKLARLHRDAGRFVVAETHAREALFIDVLNEDARKLLLESLRAQKKDAEAERLEARYQPDAQPKVGK